MSGLPPTPPREGCFGMVILVPSGISTNIGLESDHCSMGSFDIILKDQLHAKATQNNFAADRYLRPARIIAVRFIDIHADVDGYVELSRNLLVGADGR